MLRVADKGIIIYVYVRLLNLKEWMTNRSCRPEKKYHKNFLPHLSPEIKAPGTNQNPKSGPIRMSPLKGHKKQSTCQYGSKTVFT